MKRSDTKWLLVGLLLAGLVAFGTRAAMATPIDPEISFELAAQQGSGKYTITTTNTGFADPNGVTVTVSGGQTVAGPFAGDSSEVYKSTNTTPTVSCVTATTSCQEIKIVFNKPVLITSVLLLNGDSSSETYGVSINGGASTGVLVSAAAGKTLDQVLLAGLAGPLTSIAIDAPTVCDACFPFGIDDIKWTDTPESASLSLVALGLGLVVIVARRRGLVQGV